MINPMTLLQLQNQKRKFDENHPKFGPFLNRVSQEAIQEGTVFEITVTTPEGQNLCTNFIVKQSDLELLETIKGMLNQAQQ